MKRDFYPPSPQAFSAASRFRAAVVADADTASLEHHAPHRRKSPWWGRSAVYTAATVGLLVVAVTVPSVRSLVLPGGLASKAITYSATRGERKTVELPDGSRVVLAPDTKVEYVTAGHDRTVTLHGQAYFTVAHQATSPFIVHSSGMTTRVLGTSFVIRAYESDVLPHIAVTEGKVEVSTNDAKRTLLPGDIAHVTRQGDISVANNASMTDVVGWMRGQLVFDGVPLRDMVVELERTYNITIMISDTSLADQHVTMSISGDSQQDMLENLAFIANAKITEESPGIIRLVPRS